VPFEKLVLELQGRASIGLSPLFQAVFTQLDTGDGTRATMGELKAEPYALENPTTKFDLTLFMADRPDGLRLTLRGRSDLHRADSIARFLGHLRTVLEAVARDATQPVSALPLLTWGERDALAHRRAATVDEGAATTVHDSVAAVAARVPERVAVTYGDRALSYGELDVRANRLARELLARGVGIGEPVGVVLDRSVDIPVAILGILRAGAAYVPLLPDVPPARAARQAADLGMRRAVTANAYADRVPPGVDRVSFDGDAAAIGAHPASAPDVPVTPDAVAYVLHTSGSTGTPKGVAVTHANIVHYARAISRVLADVPADVAGDGFAAIESWRFGMVTTIGTDLGNTALFPALLAGGTLHIAAAEVATGPDRFAEFITKGAIDVVKITPSHLRALGAGGAGHALPARWLVLGGEALPIDFAATLNRSAASRGCRVLNHYGPTETTVGCATFEVTASALGEATALGAQTVPVGVPLPNTTLHVLDPRGGALPDGVPGELYVGGAGVTQGYVNRPDLTADRFVPLDDAPRAYRTGDRVRWLPNGTIEFLGRVDDQVKVRGYRVELGEIEHVMSGHPGVEQSVVVLREDSGAAELIGYVVPTRSESGYAHAHAGRTDAREVREWLANQLPEYMVPSAIVVLERLPLLASGKVDRGNLPAPGATEASATVVPRTPTETALAAIWRDVLKRDEVGVTDDFVALGGHSLLAIRVLGKLSKQFGVRLPLRTLFDAPTIEALAEVVDLEVQLAALEQVERAQGRDA
jgi:amino acid adenylation domain-containing protein